MADKVRTHSALAELARRQHGVVSARQLADLGYSRDSVSYASRAGRLHRIHRGVYAVGHASLTWEGRCHAAVLACGPRAVASHVSAAWAWGLLRTRPGTIHVTVPTRRHGRSDLRIHFGRLTGEDRGVGDGIPVTSLPRTMLDIASELSANRLERAIERSEELRLFDLPAVESLLDRAGGHPGAGRLRQALAIYRDDRPFTRSGLERRFRELVEEARLPVPIMNFDYGAYEIDAFWPQERFAVELDVYETHGTRAAFERDRLRQEDLKLEEVEMIRVTGPRLDREPREVLERLGALLRQRRRQLGLDPDTG